MDILFEFLFEVVLELMTFIVPENKIKKKYQIILKIIVILFTIGSIVLFIWGLSLVINSGNSLGLIPISISIIIILAQIIAGYKLYNKHHND